MQNYCTLFDINYLVQGYSLFLSMVYQINDKFNLYVLCMDDESYRVIKSLNIENLLPLTVLDVSNEDDILQSQNKNRGQICWMYQPILCEYILKKLKNDSVVYLEADSLFFKDPKNLLSEIANYSVSIVPHNYDLYNKKFEKTSGKYCVQFNYFKNDIDGLRVLEYWRRSCYKYDSNKPEVYPGQISLESWDCVSDKVRIIKNLGAGVAPWNINNREIRIKNNTLYFGKDEMIFFHFHQFSKLVSGGYLYALYKIPKNCNFIFIEYINYIEYAKNFLSINSMKSYNKPISLFDLIRNFSWTNFLDYLRYIKMNSIGIFSDSKKFN